MTTSPDSLPDSASETPERSKSGVSQVLKWVVLSVLLLGIGTAIYLFQQQVAQTEAANTNEAILKILAAQESSLRQLQSSQPVLTAAIAFIVYVTATGFSLPGALVLTLLYGWFFGFLNALLIVSFASTMGATISMLLSRYLFRDAVESRFGSVAKKFNAAIDAEGSFYLLTLRLIPQVPFFMINIVMGLTKFPTIKYWIVSQLGMLPGTVIYVYAGSSLPSLQELAEKGIGGAISGNLNSLLIAFTLLGVVPLFLKLIINYFRSTPASPEQ